MIAWSFTAHESRSIARATSAALSGGSSSWRNHPLAYHLSEILQLVKRASTSCVRKFTRLTVSSSTAKSLLNVGVYAHDSYIHTARPSCDGLAVPVNRAVLCTEQKSGWQLLLRRFRSLRATLVSQGDVSLFAVRVYLWSTDVSLCAPDHTECLKGLQPLVCQLFPVFSHQQQRHQSQTFLESNNDSVDTQVCTQAFVWCQFQLLKYICHRMHSHVWLHPPSSCYCRHAETGERSLGWILQLSLTLPTLTPSASRLPQQISVTAMTSTCWRTDSASLGCTFSGLTMLDCWFCTLHACRKPTRYIPCPAYLTPSLCRLLHLCPIYVLWNIQCMSRAGSTGVAMNICSCTACCSISATHQSWR